MTQHSNNVVIRLWASGEVERDPEMERLRDENENLRHALGRTRNVLGNMAAEHETGWRSIFARWPIHHEPLRSDARHLLPVIDAALAGPQKASRQWICNGDPEQPSPAVPGRPIAAAPVNEEVFVYCGEMRFRAKLVPGASMTMDEEPCDQWQAMIEGEHPPCWSDGCCWANNEDENTSLQPTHWSPIAPAPSSPGVPDSVRALSEAADYAAERYVESVDAEGLSDRERYRLNIQARAARRQFEDACTDFVRTLISAQPAGQSTGQGIGWAEVVKAICSAVCRVEGLDPDELRQEYESEAHGWRDTDPQWTRYAEAVAEVLDALPLPSPDSARTGQVGTDDPDVAYQRGKEDGYSEGVLDAAARAGLTLEYGVSYDPERHVPGPVEMLQRIAEHTDALAARPAAPEAQGAWHWTDRDGHPVRDAEQGEQWLLTWSEASATYDINCIDGDWPHGDAIKLLCMDAWKWIETSPGAPPASSGQGGR